MPNFTLQSCTESARSLTLNTLLLLLFRLRGILRYLKEGSDCGNGDVLGEDFTTREADRTELSRSKLVPFEIRSDNLSHRALYCTDSGSAGPAGDTCVVSCPD